MSRILRMLKFIMALAFFISQVHCAHPQKFQEHLQTQDCDQALKSVPENQEIYKISQMSEQAGGTLISYSFTGAAYTAQVLWDVSVGLTAAIVLCAPSIAVIMTSKSQPISSATMCIPADIKPILSPSLGKQAYQKSESLRCPTLKPLSESIRKVAQCYSQKQTKADNEKAIKLLESLKDSKSFYQCLPNDEIVAFTKDLQNYQNQAQLYQ